MVVRYPAEPVLAEAACSCLHGTNTHSGDMDFPRIAKLLSIFIARCLRGLVNVGEVGELLARVILSLSFDATKLSHFYNGIGPLSSHGIFSVPISVKDFLNSFISPTYASAYLKAFGKDPRSAPSEDFLRGEVCFTNWTRLSTFKPKLAFVKMNWIGACFAKRTAVMFQFNQTGTDLLIPVRLATGAYTFILIQVKNRSEVADPFKYAGGWLSPSHCFQETPWHEEYLSFYMEVGPENSSEALAALSGEAIIEHERAFPHHILLLGFDSMKIGASACLESILKLACRRQIEYMDESKRGDILAKMEPIAFEFSASSCTCIKAQCVDNRCGCRKRSNKCGLMCICSDGTCNNAEIAMDID